MITMNTHREHLEDLDPEDWSSSCLAAVLQADRDTSTSSLPTARAGRSSGSTPEAGLAVSRQWVRVPPHGLPTTPFVNHDFTRQ